jgi:hypothetical protein
MFDAHTLLTAVIRSAEKVVDRLAEEVPDVIMILLDARESELTARHCIAVFEIHLLASELVSPRFTEAVIESSEKSAPKMVKLADPVEGTLFHRVVQRIP